MEGYVVGQDNFGGQAIVSDGSTTIKGRADAEPAIHTVAVVTRARSKEGARSAVVETKGRKSTISSQSILTQGTTGQATTQSCPGNSSPSPAPEPGDPEPQPEPQPPSPPGSPNDPPEEDEPSSTPVGCDPNDDCQWYNAASGDAPCPAGTTYQGFAELPGGSFKILCCGPQRPSGDGCPTDPTTFGWSCDNGTCRNVPNGTFATFEECQGTCRANTFECANGSCVEVFDGSGSFATLADCEASCGGADMGWNCVEQTCVKAPGGRFASLADCKAAQCECQRGVTPGVAYRYRYIDRRAPSCFQVPPFQQFSGAFYVPFSFELRCCLGALGSRAMGMYGTWTDANGATIGPQFLTGSCATLATGSPPGGCETCFWQTDFVLERVDGTPDCPE